MSISDVAVTERLLPTIAEVMADLNHTAAALDDFEINYSLHLDLGKPEPDRPLDSTVRVVRKGGTTFEAWDTTLQTIAPDGEPSGPKKFVQYSLREPSRFWFVSRGVDGAPDSNVILWSYNSPQELSADPEFGRRLLMQPPSPLDYMLGHTNALPPLPVRYEKSLSDGTEENWSLRRDGDLYVLSYTPQPKPYGLVSQWWLDPSRGMAVVRWENHDLHDKLVFLAVIDVVADHTGGWYPRVVRCQEHPFTGMDLPDKRRNFVTVSFDRPSPHGVPLVDWMKIGELDPVLDQRDPTGSIQFWAGGELVSAKEMHDSMLPLPVVQTLGGQEDSPRLRSSKGNEVAAGAKASISTTSLLPRLLRLAGVAVCVVVGVGAVIIWSKKIRG